MSKWRFLKDKIPGFQPAPEEQKKLEKFVARLEQEFWTDHSDQTAVPTKELWENLDYRRKWLQVRFRDAKLRKEAIEEDLSEQNGLVSATTFMLLEVRDAQELSDSVVRDPEGFGYGEEPVPYASVSDNVAFDRWAEQNGWKDLYTINFQTLNASVKKLLEANEPIPDGVEVYFKNKIKLYKPR